MEPEGVRQHLAACYGARRAAAAHGLAGAATAWRDGDGETVPLTASDGSRPSLFRQDVSEQAQEVVAEYLLDLGGGKPSLFESGKQTRQPGA